MRGTKHQYPSTEQVSCYTEKWCVYDTRTELQLIVKGSIILKCSVLPDRCVITNLIRMIAHDRCFVVLILWILWTSSWSVWFKFGFGLLSHTWIALLGLRKHCKLTDHQGAHKSIALDLSGRNLRGKNEYSTSNKYLKYSWTGSKILERIPSGLS